MLTLIIIVGVSAFRAASVYGPGVGPVFFADFYCGGTEANILDCTQNRISLGTTCTHDRDVAVRCEGW